MKTLYLVQWVRGYFSKSSSYLFFVYGVDEKHANQEYNQTIGKIE